MCKSGRTNAPRRQDKKGPGKKFKVGKRIRREERRAEADRRIEVEECAKAAAMTT